MLLGHTDAGTARSVGMHRWARSAPVLLLLFLPAVGAAASLLGDIVGTKSSKVYHTHPLECPAARRINPDNLVHFASVEEAEASGRRLCKTCDDLDRRSEGGGKTRRGGGGSSGRKPAGPTGGDPPTRDDRPATDGDGELVLSEYAGVAGVLPGGTIELDIGEKAVLYGIICPAAGQPCASEAERFIREQTSGRRVRLLRDGTSALTRQRDELGRLLVYLSPEPDGRDLGAELLFQGYAWLDRQSAFERRREYVNREEEAWRSGRGIWQPLNAPAGERKVVSGRFAENYHDPKCPHVAHLTGKIALTVNEAKARRLTPCSHFQGEKPAASRGRDSRGGRDDEKKPDNKDRHTETSP